MQVSAWDEEPRENNKNKHRLFWIICGIAISVLAAAAICIPLGVTLARQVDTATTSITATIVTTSITATIATTVVATTAAPTTTVATTTVVTTTIATTVPTTTGVTTTATSGK